MRSSHPAGPDMTAASTTDLTAWSNAELARGWGRTHGPRSVREVAVPHGLRELRRDLLDERERRDPAGFHRWTDGGAWISGSTVPSLGA